MKKYFVLLKLLFVQQFKSRIAVITESKKKRVGSLLLFVLLGVCFAPLLVGIAVAMYYVGRLSGGNVHIGTFLIILCQGVVLMFGVHAVISNVFVVKDAEKLLYLPVRAHVIFLAKLTVVYFNELITTALTILVVMLPFGLGAQLGVAYYLMLPVAILLIPLLPMLLGSLVAMPISALITAFSKNSIVKTVLRIVIYVAIMALYMYFMYGFGFLTGSENGNIFDNPETFIQGILGDMSERLRPIMPYFHSDYSLMNSMLYGSFVSWLLNFLAAVGENLVLLALVFAVSLPFYRRMLAMTVEEGASRRKANKEQYKVQNKGVVRELISSDFKKTMRDSQLGFQSFAGLMMMPIIVVILYFIVGISNEGSSSFLEIMGISQLYQAIAPLVIFAYMTFIGIGTNVLGLYPISRENKSVALLKSLPVPFGKILLAKVLLASAVMIVSDFISCVLIVALFGIKWYYGLAMLASMALVGFGAMCITTLLDLKSPRLGWENFNHGLKNAKNSWCAMLIAFLSILAFVALSVPFILLYIFFHGGWYWLLLMWIVDLGASAAFTAVAYKIMNGKAARYFERIEV